MIKFDHRAFFRCICIIIVSVFLIGIMFGGCTQKLLTLRQMAKTDDARDQFRDATKKVKNL
jgi:hypothetical protein